MCEGNNVILRAPGGRRAEKSGKNLKKREFLALPNLDSDLKCTEEWRNMSQDMQSMCVRVTM